MQEQTDQYRAKHHTIRAFQLRHNCVTPEWFDEAVKCNLIQIVNNPVERHVTIYDTKGGMRKAYFDNGDWVCINLSGVIFPMTNEEFERGFEPDDLC